MAERELSFEEVDRQIQALSRETTPSQASQRISCVWKELPATLDLPAALGAGDHGLSMKLWIGVTDNDWFRFLRSLSGVEEVNFWRPGAQGSFKALKPGELFLFKLHSPENFTAWAARVGACCCPDTHR